MVEEKEQTTELGKLWNTLKKVRNYYGRNKNEAIGHLRSDDLKSAMIKMGYMFENQGEIKQLEPIIKDMQSKALKGMYGEDNDKVLGEYACPECKVAMEFSGDKYWCVNCGTEVPAKGV